MLKITKLKPILCQTPWDAIAGGAHVAVVRIIKCIRTKIELLERVSKRIECCRKLREKERERDEEFNTNTKVCKRRTEMKRCVMEWTRTDWLGCSKAVSCIHTSRNPLRHLSYMLSYYFSSIYYWEIKTELGLLSRSYFLYRAYISWVTVLALLGFYPLHILLLFSNTSRISNSKVIPVTGRGGP
jgi:hypothetical protein